MFGKKTEKLNTAIQEYKKDLDSYKIDTYNQLDEINKKLDIIRKENNNDAKKEFSKTEQLKAAYALNLCTVSVAQIVDYDDLNILEQEYEAILNNIKLQNFPDDPALLNILKDILKTITFFKLQEGDKKFVEKDYQQKMKSAIWSAVPNMAVILATGNPWAMLGALATQVGIGYMNYRKEKAKISDEHEKQLWQLQRSAIEQLNSLRCSLFDTAWKLSGKYGFEDNLRLTERQITQYNQIIMDSDYFRRYERLDAIKKEFDAYPPFWYYYGDAACQIANEARIMADSDDEEQIIENKYKKLAIEHFETFRKVNNLGLLREDKIASSCCLEYIDLLDPNLEKKLIKDLIKEAINTSGRANDILQLCALNYLKIEEYDKAAKLLRILVVEGFNANTNAQILSKIYLENAIQRSSLDLLPEYKTLGRFVPEEYLYPFPSILPKTEEEKNKLAQEYMFAQQNVLLQKYALVYNSLIRKYTIEINKKLQNPQRNEYIDDSYFIDSEDCRNKRINEIKLLLTNNNRDAFRDYLNYFNINIEYIKTLNSVVDSFQKLDFLYDVDISSIGIKLNEAKDTFKKLDCHNKGIDNSSFSVDDFNDLSNLSIEFFIKDYLYEITSATKKYVSNIKDFSDCMKAENQLRNLCLSEQIDEPDILFDRRNERKERNTTDVHFSIEKYASKEAQDFVEFKKRQEKQIEILKDYKTDAKSLSKKHSKLDLYIKGSGSYSEYLSKAVKKSSTISKLKKESNIIAILDDKTWDNIDYVFATDKLYLIQDNKYCRCEFYYSQISQLPQSINYQDILNGKGVFYDSFKNKYLKRDLLGELLTRLAANELKEESDSQENSILLLDDKTRNFHEFAYDGLPHEMGKILDENLLN